MHCRCCPALESAALARRRGLVAAALAALGVAHGALAAPAASKAGAPERIWLPLAVFYALHEDDEAVALAALARIREQWRNAYFAILLETAGFLPRGAARAGALQWLSKVSGAPPGSEPDRYYAWLWSIDPGMHPDYAEFKAALYEPIDGRFREYFANRPKASIRLDEIRWGGVRRDGIPPLKNPKMIAAGAADWLGQDDVVFGIAIDGDVRAYPKRILAWHEMFKDSIAGREMAGVYCTLCGALVLYEAAAGGVHHELGTSGFLYRSNKLMYDQATRSMWSTLTGGPVVGPLVGLGIELKWLHVVTTTWREWRSRHPASQVLSLDTGYRRDYSEGAAYRDYFASDRLMFGVPRLDDRLANKAEVLALRAPRPAEESLAIAADYLVAHPIHHDRIAGTELVVLTDASGANRVYASRDARFVSWDGKAGVRDQRGAIWRMDEARLIGPNQQSLERLPAHRAFWFGWYAAYPATRLVK